MDWFFLLIPLLFVVAGLTGYYIARHDIDGGWGDYWQHTCGYINRYGGDFGGKPCRHCGDRTGWKKVVARAKFPFGWEVRTEQKAASEAIRRA